MKKELFDKEESYLNDPNYGAMFDKEALEFREALIDKLLSAQHREEEDVDLRKIEEEENRACQESDYDLVDGYDRNLNEDFNADYDEE